MSSEDTPKDEVPQNSDGEGSNSPHSSTPPQSTEDNAAEPPACSNTDPRIANRMRLLPSYSMERSKGPYPSDTKTDMEPSWLGFSRNFYDDDDDFSESDASISPPPPPGPLRRTKSCPLGRLVKRMKYSRGVWTSNETSTSSTVSSSDDTNKTNTNNTNTDRPDEGDALVPGDWAPGTEPTQ